MLNETETLYVLYVCYKNLDLRHLEQEILIAIAIADQSDRAMQ